MLADSVLHKRSLVSLVSEYLDVFATSDSDVGTTSLTFHERDTGDTRPLRQPVRRLPYGEIQRTVEAEIEKLTEARSLARQRRYWLRQCLRFERKMVSGECALTIES